METTSDMVNASSINFNLNTFCNIFSLISKENEMQMQKQIMQILGKPRKVDYYQFII